MLNNPNKLNSELTIPFKNNITKRKENNNSYKPLLLRDTISKEGVRSSNAVKDSNTETNSYNIVLDHNKTRRMITLGPIINRNVSVHLN